VKEAIGLFQKVGDRASEAYALGLMASIYVDLKNRPGGRRDSGCCAASAQMGMLNDAETRAPFYWAAFVLQGEWR